MPKKVNKILFIVNQLLSDTALAGGEVRTVNLLRYYSSDPSFKVLLEAPSSVKKLFAPFKAIEFTNAEISFIENLLLKKDKTLNAFEIFMLFFIRSNASVSKILNMKDFPDMVYSTGDFFCDVIPSWLIKKRHPQTVWAACTHHIIENPFYRKQNSFLRNIFSLLLQRFSYSLMKNEADLIFTDNNQVAATLVGIGFAPKVIKIMGNALDVKYTKDLINSQKIKPRNRVVFFARLSPTKGVFDLPEVFSQILKKYPKMSLDLVGAYEDKVYEKLKNMFSQYGILDRVVFHGFMKEKKDVFKIILSGKLVLFPSYEEGWGISMFECMLCKRPVAAYALPVFKEIFGKRFKSAPIGDTKTLAKLSVQFLDSGKKIETSDYIDYCFKIASLYDWETVFHNEKSELVKRFIARQQPH